MSNSSEVEQTKVTSAIIGKKLSEIVPANSNQILEETKQFLSSQKLNLQEYRQIWKGIFFAMWASDKVPVQEKLGEELSNLVFSVATLKFEAVSLWMKACFSILKKEWNKIDYWRVNKFSSLVRKTITAFLRYLRKKGFNLALQRLFIKYVREYNKIIQEELYVEITSTVGGLALHVLQIYPEVIANFTWATHDQVHLLLDLFLKQIGPTVCKNLKNKIKEHVFERMLAMKESDGKFQNFNMKKYRDSLFKIAKNQKTEETARKEIYDLVELFDNKVNMEEEEARFAKYIKEKEEKETKSKEKKETVVKSEKKDAKKGKNEKEESAPKKKQKLNEENTEKSKQKGSVEEKKETVKTAKELKIEKKRLEKQKRVEEEEARLFAEEQKKIDEENKVAKQKLKKGETAAAFIKTHEDDEEEDEEKDQDWLDEDDEGSENDENEDGDDGEFEMESDLDEEELAMLLKSTGEDIEVDDMDDDFYNEEDFEGYDVADVTQNETRMKGLQSVYNSLPQYHFLTDPQKLKYFNSVTNKFKNNLQEEHLSPCAHGKKVVFNTQNNKVKEFDLNQKVVALENTPTLVKAKKTKKNQK